jgi:hypothetical protein
MQARRAAPAVGRVGLGISAALAQRDVRRVMGSAVPVVTTVPRGRRVVSIKGARFVVR